MAITTWLNENERETWKWVHDKELNDVFQEVRQKVSNKYLLQMQLFSERKNIFSKSNAYYRYTLYVDLGHEAQVVNFYSDGSRSINTQPSKEMVMAYFFGLLNGFESAQRAYADRPAPEIAPFKL